MIWIRFGCLLGFLAVCSGAFGAHFLKKHLSEYSLTIFNTAVQYKMFHGLGLILLGLSSYHADFKQNFINNSGICFLLGVFLFSASLFILALFPQQKWFSNKKFFLYFFGGLLFLAGWVFFGLAITK